jgi:hypothetical protein
MYENYLWIEEFNMKKFKVENRAIGLNVGTMYVYDFDGGVRVHAYETKDVFNSYQLLIEKNGKLVIVEPLLIKSNYEELRDYINSIGYTEADLIVSYHNLGATFADSDKLKINNVYSMQSTEDYVYINGVEANKNIKSGLGEVFDEKIWQNVIICKEGMNTIGGIEFYMHENEYGFDIGIPEIKIMHTHFVGHDKHILVWDMNFLSYTAKDLEDYLEAGYDMFMSAHGEVETRADVQQKIRYFYNLKSIYEDSKNGSEFKSKLTSMYPDLDWTNYLDMTASILYHEEMVASEI